MSVLLFATGMRTACEVMGHSYSRGSGGRRLLLGRLGLGLGLLRLGLLRRRAVGQRARCTGGVVGGRSLL